MTTRNIVRLPVLALLASALLSGCTTEPVPTTLVPNQTSLALDAIGATATLSVTVNDQDGEPITGETVTWTSSNANVATVSAGLVTAVSVGTADITATVGGASVTVPVTVSQAPAIVAIVSGDGQTGVAGDQLASALVVQINDRLETAVPGISVTFAVIDGGGTLGNTSATSGADGQVSTTWTLGTTVGTNQAEASITGGAVPARFTATGITGPASAVSVAGGDNQFAVVDMAVDVAPAVLVEDANGNPVEGVNVDFAVATGGGMVTGEAAVTGATGVATVGSWTLGPTEGANTLTATVEGTGITGNPVTFTATAVSSLYDIEVRFVGATAPTMAQQNAFDAAVAGWQSVLIGDLPDQLLNISIPAGGCRSDDVVTINETIDDLVILAEITTIDGPGNIAGQASWCVVRPTGDGLPLLGVMEFDVDDLPALEAAGNLDDVILHEMGHVLGFGTLWNSFLQLPSDPAFGGTPGNDTHFNGPEAIIAFDAISNKPYAGGNKVPVENDNGSYGSGSLDAHWRESVFSIELMTPTINGGVMNPLSRVTVASLEDLGYVADQNAADAFALVFPFRLTPLGPGLVLQNDVLRRPGYTIDASGQLIRVR
jgi:hypothetical protein